MITRLLSGLCLCLVLACSSSLLVPSAEAALCPGANLSTVCADFTEGGGPGIAMQSTTVVISRDGVALPSIVIPSSSSAGKQTQFTSVTTLACQSDVYTATARSTYTIGSTVFQGLFVNATPGAGVTKDRVGEPACVEAPSNFSLH